MVDAEQDRGPDARSVSLDVSEGRINWELVDADRDHKADFAAGDRWVGGWWMLIRLVLLPSDRQACTRLGCRVDWSVVGADQDCRADFGSASPGPLESNSGTVV